MDDRFSFRAMGSMVDVATLASSRPSDVLLAECSEFVARLERTWSRFDPSSELVRLNLHNGAGSLAVSSSLCDAVDAALALWRATDGYFDPTVIDALEWWGYDEDFARLRARNAAADCVAVVARPWPPAVPTPEGVIVDHERGTIDIPAGVRIDLGGVGKGLAADLLAEHLIGLGVAGACVSVGGDIAVAGENPPDGWSIPVLDPAHGNRIGWNVPLHSGAIVQSNRIVRAWRSRGADCHHLIDPRTAAPADGGVLGVVVRADRAWWAEGVAKAALVAGLVEGAALLRRLAPAAWMIRDDGSVVVVGDVSIGRAA